MNGIYKRLSVWLRAIRIKFLLASIIAVANGISIGIWKEDVFDSFFAITTFFGIICLHISVDLFNDYWDFKRGIDSHAKGTKFSGGTGVIPDNLLSSRSVYLAGLIFLILGSLTGLYFVIQRGVVILIILSFAIISIYFYSTNIVNWGLAEIFVAIKGTMIVLGAFFVQTGHIDVSAIFSGIVIGSLSSTVLLVTSFPDFEADKNHGRRTLVILIGKKNGVNLVSIVIAITYALILISVFFGLIPIFSLISLLSIPFSLKAIRFLKMNYDDLNSIIPAMSNTVLYSRITGVLLTLSFLM